MADNSPNVTGYAISVLIFHYKLGRETWYAVDPIIEIIPIGITSKGTLATATQAQIKIQNGLQGTWTSLVPIYIYTHSLAG